MYASDGVVFIIENILDDDGLTLVLEEGTELFYR